MNPVAQWVEWAWAINAGKLAVMLLGCGFFISLGATLPLLLMAIVNKYGGRLSDDQ